MICLLAEVKLRIQYAVVDAVKAILTRLDRKQERDGVSGTIDQDLQRDLDSLTEFVGLLKESEVNEEKMNLFGVDMQETTDTVLVTGIAQSGSSQVLHVCPPF